MQPPCQSRPAQGHWARATVNARAAPPHTHARSDALPHTRPHAATSTHLSEDASDATRESDGSNNATMVVPDTSTSLRPRGAGEYTSPPRMRTIVVAAGCYQHTRHANRSNQCNLSHTLRHARTYWTAGREVGMKGGPPKPLEEGPEFGRAREASESLMSKVWQPSQTRVRPARRHQTRQSTSIASE